jgi:hypothetical protein
MAANKLIYITLLTLLFAEKAKGQSERKVNQSRLQPSELLINSTVKIESLFETYANSQNKLSVSTASGFFYLFKIDSISIPVLVTNYHTIANSIITKITFTESDTLFNPVRGKNIEYVNENLKNGWIKHPTYDLAILALYPVFESIYNEKHKRVTYIPFEESVIPSEEVLKGLSAIEQLFMIGYPKGYGDKFNNYPIVRRGTTATPVYSNYDNKQEFLLDIPIYSGSSGSPVVLLNEGSYAKNGGLVAGSRMLLIGIAAQSVVLQSQQIIKGTELDNPLNIAVVIKASMLKDFKPILSSLIDQQKARLRSQKPTN